MWGITKPKTTEELKKIREKKKKESIINGYTKQTVEKFKKNKPNYKIKGVNHD